MSLCFECKTKNTLYSADDNYQVLRCTVDNNARHHSFNDEPSCVWISFVGATGRRWDKNGIIHRDKNRPAVTHSDGYKAWYCEGRRTKVKERSNKPKKK